MGRKTQNGKEEKNLMDGHLDCDFCDQTFTSPTL